MSTADDFIWSDTPEPHAARRKEILASHPSVSKLNGPDWRSKYICLFALVVPQIGLSVFAPRLPWVWYLLAAYVIGATITQALFLAVHELAHNLFFRKARHNRVFAWIANLPIGLPFAAAFRVYHLQHHKFQGEDGVDADVPSRMEARIFRGRAGKLVWLTVQIVAYALRPLFTHRLPVSADLVGNWATQFAFDALLCWIAGPAPLRFLLLCAFLSGGLHPCAGHFIAEHYAFPKDGGQETYSYYGPLNWLTWNVGYHNEHHDFPYVPWSRLPRVRSTAPEHYDSLAHHDSWCRVMYDYVMRDDMGPTRRVKRPAHKSE
mmetsp:Transcript_16040/g.33091  ORF Transcript_16040/g.33091 Transcript_16040/m.33091 type:complete len:319 (+) Transcript_16040:317-1273(+)